MLVDRIDALRAAVVKTRERYPFVIDAVVVLPDHIHAVWTLPPGDADFSLRWRLIKSRFSQTLPKQERISDVRRLRNERGIWQRRFWEHLIRDCARRHFSGRLGGRHPCKRTVRREIKGVAGAAADVTRHCEKKRWRITLR